MTVIARLYDADGVDRDVDLADLDPGEVDDHQLLWIDVDERTTVDIDAVARALDLEPRIVEQLAPERRRPRLVRQPDRISVTLIAVERDEESDRNGGGEVVRKDLDLVVGRNIVVTVHDGPVKAIEEYDEQLGDERDLGRLDAGAFMTGLVDAVIGGYLREVESIEREIDELDGVALRALRDEDTFLAAAVRLRRRIAVLRRSLTPNRDALAPLVRPDFRVHEDIVEPWPGIVDRLERAIDAVENARDLLVGSFDVYLGHSAQRSNDVMKTLALVSSIALPAIVLAGLMGMNFQLAFFDNPNNFVVVVGSMILFAVAIVVFARWRRWV